MPNSSQGKPPAPTLRGVRTPLLAAVIAGALMALGSVFMPNYYRSEARLLPSETKGGGSALNLAVAFGMGAGLEGGDANYVDILKSRWLREEVAKTRFEFNESTGRFRPSRQHNETLVQYFRVDNLDQAAGAVGSVLWAARDAKSKMITLSAETRSPELSKQMADLAIRLLETFLIDKSQTRAGAKAAFTTIRLKEAREDEAKAETDLRSFIQVNRNFYVSPDPLVRLDGARREAEYKLKQQLVVTVAMNREQALMDAKNDVPILNVLDAPNLPITRSRPARSALVALVFVLVGLGWWMWQHRIWLLAFMGEREELPEE